MLNIVGILSGLAMVLVGLIAIFYWRKIKRSKYSLFLYGGIFWFVSYAIKVIMDLTITPVFQETLLQSMPILLGLISVGIMLGIRTGILECGVTYIGAWVKKFKDLSFNDCVAVGIGFGAIESIYLGLMIALTGVIFMMDPAAWDAMPESIKMTLMTQSEVWYILVTAIERVSSVIIHVFTTVLVIYSLKLNEIKWLVLSIVFKSPFDMVVPVFNYYNFVVYEGSLGFIGYGIVEAIFLIIAGISLYLLIWFKNRYGASE